MTISLVGDRLLTKRQLQKVKKENVHLKSETTENDYVSFRTKRDQTLSAPRLLFPSLQANIAAGYLPPPDEKGPIS